MHQKIVKLNVLQFGCDVTLDINTQLDVIIHINSDIGRYPRHKCEHCVVCHWYLIYFAHYSMSVSCFLVLILLFLFCIVCCELHEPPITSICLCTKGLNVCFFSSLLIFLSVFML